MIDVDTLEHFAIPVTENSTPVSSPSIGLGLGIGLGIAVAIIVGLLLVVFYQRRNIALLKQTGKQNKYMHYINGVVILMCCELRLIYI